MSQPEMVIFTRTFDLLAWLLPVTNHFPRAHRHDFTRRLLDAAFDLRERLEEANLRSPAEPQPDCQAARLNAEDAKVLAKAAEKHGLRVPLRKPPRPLR